MEACRIEGLIDYISEKYKNAAEIGIGHFPNVAYSLLRRGVKVFATDIKPFRYNGLEVIVDNIIDPDFIIYNNVKIIYSIRPPVELVPYMRRLAKELLADLIVKSLASEYLDGQLIRNGNTTFYLWEL